MLINRDTSAERSLAELHRPPAGSYTKSEGNTNSDIACVDVYICMKGYCPNQIPPNIGREHRQC